MYAYYIHTLCYIHTVIYEYMLYICYIHAVMYVDTYMTAVCTNVYMIMFNVYITALGCFDGYVRAVTLIADRLRITFTLITDSCY